MSPVEHKARAVVRRPTGELTDYEHANHHQPQEEAQADEEPPIAPFV